MMIGFMKKRQNRLSYDKKGSIGLTCMNPNLLAHRGQVVLI